MGTASKESIQTMKLRELFRLCRLICLLGTLILVYVEPAKATPNEKLVIPERGAYTGAYVDFGDMEDSVTLESLQQFEELVRKPQAIIGFSSFWGRQTFPSEAVQIVHNYGAVSLIYWNPWDGSGKSNPNRFSLESILAGSWDSYIDSWAAGAKAFGHPLMVSWGLEMNGNWFPWSGVFAGAGEPGSSPGDTKGPEAFKKAYRYVVDRVRRASADNVIWVYHVNNSSDPDVPWNTMAAYYPGDEYVDWLGMSAYGKQYPGPGWSTFEQSIGYYYPKLAALHPTKPIILAEWGIGEFPKEGDKGAWLDEAFQAFTERFPRLKGAVFWHERWQNADLRYSNLRVHSSMGSLEAYRRGVANPFWLGRPLVTGAPVASPTP